MAEARWIDTAEVAKLLRARLKREFPATKFSVRISRYAGGSSIRVAWTDGPTDTIVRPIVKEYDGGGFDGSIDMSYEWSNWLLPDGSAIVAVNRGTAGSRGYDTGEVNEKPHPDAELVRFCCKYLSTDREVSLELARKCAAQVADYYGVPTPELVAPSRNGWGTWDFADPAIRHTSPIIGGSSHEHGWGTLIRQAAEDASRFRRELTPEQGAALVADAGRMTREEALQLDEAMAATDGLLTRDQVKARLQVIS